MGILTGTGYIEPMRRVSSFLATTCTALALAGCGFADSRAPFPAFMRTREAEPPPPEPPPDVKQLVRNRLDSVFTSGSHARNVRVSPPRRNLNGMGWTACFRAELTSVIGKPLGTQTFLATINGGVILDRRRVENDIVCATETYEPI